MIKKKKKKDLKAQTDVQLHLQPSRKWKAQPKPILLPKKRYVKDKALRPTAPAEDLFL